MDRLDDDKIFAFFEGKASNQDLKEIYEWIRSSEENTNEFFEMENTYRSVKAACMPHEQIDNAYYKIIDKLTKEEKRRKTIKFRRIIYSSAAAVLLIILGIGVFFNKFEWSRYDIVMAQAPADDVIKLSLEDGTLVWLNNDSRIYYPKKFSGRKRNVEVEGEAYFEVVKDNKRPFTVIGEKISVRVLGTKFNFKDNLDEQEASVSLLEGAVEVEGNKNQGKVQLSPGQSVSLSNSGKSLSVKKKDTSLDTIWKDNIIPFVNADAETIARKLEAIYNVNITIEDEVKMNATYSGAINKEKTIDSVLNVLKEILSFDYMIEGKEVRIIKKN